MALTILLAKVFGIYLIVGGLAIWMRRRYFAPVLGNFVHDPLIRLIVGTLELVGGLFLVFTHNEWSTAPAAIVSLFGWMLAIEGALYMILSDKTVEKMIGALNRPIWYMIGGPLALLLGLYLCAYGFSWF